MRTIYDEMNLDKSKGLRVVAPKNTNKVIDNQETTLFGDVHLYDVIFGNTKLTVKCQVRNDEKIFISHAQEYEYIQNEGYKINSNLRLMLSLPGQDIIVCLKDYYKEYKDLDVSVSLQKLTEFNDILLKHH